MRRYGKPLPSKRDIGAALNFYKERGTMQIELEKTEMRVLLLLVGEEIRRTDKLMDHAVAHGAELEFPQNETCRNIYEKLIT